jgi:hypothetical protein
MSHGRESDVRGGWESQVDAGTWPSESGSPLDFCRAGVEWATGIPLAPQTGRCDAGRLASQYCQAVHFLVSQPGGTGRFRPPGVATGGGWGVAAGVVSVPSRGDPGPIPPKTREKRPLPR